MGERASRESRAGGQAVPGPSLRSWGSREVRTALEQAALTPASRKLAGWHTSSWGPHGGFPSKTHPALLVGVPHTQLRAGTWGQSRKEIF